MEKEIVLGIDLGTGNSVVSVYENGQTTVIPNAEGSRTTPSIVAFTKDGERLVGITAARQAVTNPTRTVHSIKRFIGRKFADIANISKLMSYKVVANKNGDAAVEIDGRIYSPEEISSFVLAKLKADAESYLGKKVSKAVITVPAYFDNAQRESTKLAGEIAGLEVLRIINEPTAAALAYGIDKQNESKIVAIYDIGQGTSDLSILDCSDGVFEVLATNGDSLLGGKDIDEAIVKLLITVVKNEYGVDLSKDNQALQRVTEAAEKAKCELSTTPTTNINIPFISMNADGPIHLTYDLTRAKLEDMIAEIFTKFKTPCTKCIEDSGKSTTEITDVLMVGGSTRVPYLQEMAKSIFSKPDVNKEINPDECVSIGAAIQGAVLAGDTSTGEILLLDVTSISYGLETEGGIFTKLIENNTTIPTRKSQLFSTAIDNQPAVTIQVYQGESRMCSRNKLIGTFNLDGIAPAPRGVPQIEVTFDIDANGLLTVTAIDKGTGKEQHISITPSSGLSKEEIEQLKQEAERYAEEDNKKADLVEAKNKAESMIYNAEKQIKEHEDKISEELKTELDNKKEALRTAKDSNDINVINTATTDFESVLMKIGEAVYAASNPGGVPPGGIDPNNMDPEMLKQMMEQMQKQQGGQTFTPGNASPDAPIDAEIVDEK